MWRSGGWRMVKRQREKETRVSFASVRIASLIAALGMFLSASFAMGQTQASVAFEAGKSFAAVEGSITGTEYADHLVSAKAGQLMSVTLVFGEYDGSANIYFDVLPPGGTGEAIHDGTVGGPGMMDATLIADGDYTIRVYHKGSDADLGKTTAYTISVWFK
jgi:hypothetical protein